MNDRKSTFSIGNGDCVEVGNEFRKSSHSCDWPTAQCVEVAAGPVVRVRDTTQGEGPGRPVLRFAPGTWNRFVSSLRLGPIVKTWA